MTGPAAGRAARRRRPRHRARAARLPARRHLDRERDQRRGPRGRRRGRRCVRGDRPRRLALPAAARRGTIRRTSTATTTSSRTRRSGFSSTSMAELVEPPSDEAWESYGRVNANVAAAVLEELEEEPGHAGLVPRLPPLPRAGGRARRAARRDALALRPHPLAAAGGVGPAARASGRARSTRACSRTTSSASTRTGGATDFLDSVGGDPRRGRPAARHRPPDLRRPAPSSTSSRERRRCWPRAASSSGSAASAPCCASTAPTRPRTSCAASRRSALYLERHPEAHGRVGMLALLDPSRQDIPQYAAYLRGDRRRGARRERAVRPRRTGCRSGSRSRTTSRARSPRTSSTTCCSSTRSRTG